MKILAINGSPKSKASCTDTLLNPLLEGMCETGATAETVYLADKTIHPCMGCFACWLKTPGKCVIQDDMEEVLNKIKEANWIIFGTPLYVYSSSGLMKNCLDRTVPLAQPFMEEQNGISVHPARFEKNCKVLLVSPCGFPEFDHFAPLVDSFKRTFRERYAGEILRPAAELMRVAHFQNDYHKYCEQLKQAGKELITQGVISEKTKNKLSKLWISPQKFREVCNKQFAEMLKTTQ